MLLQSGDLGTWKQQVNTAANIGSLRNSRKHRSLEKEGGEPI